MKKIKGSVTIGRSDDITMAEWGKIFGDIDNQTDLVDKIDNHHDDTKQNVLVSQENIKSVNGNSLVGSGNIEISSEPNEYLKRAEIIGNNLSIVKKNGSSIIYSPKVSDVCVNNTSIVHNNIANITGENLPNISTSKITSGTFSDERIASAATWNAKQDAIPDLSTIKSGAEAGSRAESTISTYGNIVTHNTSEFASSSQGAKADSAIQPNNNVSLLNNDGDGINPFITKTVNNLENYTDSTTLTSLLNAKVSDVKLNNVSVVTANEANINTVDNVTSTSLDPLSAKQGKLLNDRIDSLSNIGRFLSIWNSITGKPTSEPPGLSPGDTYTYHIGDYYRVGSINESSEGLNYKPNGPVYIVGTASTTIETERVSIGDVYYYDGTNWLMQAASAGGKVQDVLVDNISVLSNGIAYVNLTGKQDKLIVNPTETTATLSSLKVDGVNYAIDSGSMHGKVALIEGDGVTTDFIVQNEFNSKEVVIQVFDNVNNDIIQVDISKPSNSTITIGFGFAPSVGTQYKVLILSAEGYMIQYEDVNEVNF